jgi:plastocyanin
MRAALLMLLLVNAIGREAGSLAPGGASRAAVPLGNGLRWELLDAWGPAPRAARTDRTRPATEAADGMAGVQAVRQPVGSIRGQVDMRRVIDPPAARPGISDLAAPAPRDVPDYRRAVVYLESAPGGAFEEREPMRGRIDQRHETFVPRVLAVTTGSLVDFPNNDRTYHNVFSLSKTRRFDLGRYAQGKSKAVRFDRPGVVRVFCDIHSHMSAFVLVFSHRFFATTAPDGGYRIDRVPPGTYAVAAWYEGNVRDTGTVTIPPQGGPIDRDFIIR